MVDVKRHILESPQIRMVGQVLRAKKIFYIVGQNSIYVPSMHDKYIDKRVAIEWPDLDGVIEPRTPGECARLELQRAFPGLRRVGWIGKQVDLLDWRWPMGWLKRYKGRLVYTDLVAAYHQIYRRLWLNVPFGAGGFGSYDLAPVGEALADNKLSRNAVIGIISSRNTWGIKGAKRYSLASKNVFLSPPLWGTIQAILNEIAKIALDTGALYVATDGFFHPIDSKHKDFHRMLDFRGVKFRSLVADGEIRGWGSYSVGGKVTTTYNRNLPGGQVPFMTTRIFDSDNSTKFLDYWSFEVPKYRKAMEGCN